MSERGIIATALKHMLAANMEPAAIVAAVADMEQVLLSAREKVVRKSIPDWVRGAVFERDGNQCSYCGDLDGPFHLDHIHPVVLGGDNSVENLTVACVPCNLSKGGKTLEEWRAYQ